MVKYLIGLDVVSNTYVEFYGEALRNASWRGYEKVVEILLARGAEVNAQGAFYGNALQAASERGYEKMVEMLLAAGAIGIHSDSVTESGSGSGEDSRGFD